jgi:hypothetical protein
VYQAVFIVLHRPRREAYNEHEPMRIFAALALLTILAVAQPAHRVEFKCTDEDVQAIGLACTEAEPCPVFLELSSVEAVGSKLFVTGNLHTDTTTLWSILLASGDGATWSEPHPRIRNGSLEQIQFIDFENGWVGGQLLQGVPRDPFVLVTHDGGKTWRNVPLTEEGRPGSIEQFWFDSRNSGLLIVDRLHGEARHEMYESMTGGDSWSLREVGSKPLQLKRSKPVTNLDWRLRADAGSKTYRLERKEGSRWTLVASFPVRVGECRIKEPTLAEPETTDQQDKPEPEPAKPAAPKPPARKPTLERKRPPEL